MIILLSFYTVNNSVNNLTLLLTPNLTLTNTYLETLNKHDNVLKHLTLVCT